jgi:hypothetical protein
MVASITAVLKRLKTEWAAQLQAEAIIEACEEVGYESMKMLGIRPRHASPRRPYRDTIA